VKPPADAAVRCPCTLEELYVGGMKKIQYERDEFGLDGKSTKKKTELFEFELKPGYSTKTVLRFFGKGNNAYSYQTCNTYSVILI